MNRIPVVVATMLFSLSCSSPSDPDKPKPTEVVIATSFTQNQDTVSYTLPANTLGTVSVTGQTDAFDVTTFDSVTVRFTAYSSYVGTWYYGDWQVAGIDSFVAGIKTINTHVSQPLEGVEGQRANTVHEFSVTIKPFELVNKESVVFFFSLINHYEGSFAVDRTARLWGVRVSGWKVEG